MKINKKFLPQLCVSKDDYRLSLMHVNVVREHPGIAGNCIVATDGRMFVLVPCELAANDYEGILRADAFEFGKTLISQKEDYIRIVLGKKRIKFSDGTIMRRMMNTVDLNSYPDTKETSSSQKWFDETDCFEFTINYEYLIKTTKALGIKATDGVVVKYSKKGNYLHIKPNNPALCERGLFMGCAKR